MSSYKARNLLRMSLGRVEDALFIAGIVVCCRYHWECRSQEGGWIAQAWATWPEGALAPNGTVMCRGHGVSEMVTPAMNSSFAQFFKLDKV